ncbi:hypothetical protein CDAR_65711 [Caerostris darwini]|uniref:Uncharacterized protein n=1 Tax=Caerostris darwini TaxID=1538125 RepID=A0AAV4UC46_9ARAC|nr:hypothetical protein CDAR_65711 [Caerostris darwini]
MPPPKFEPEAWHTKRQSASHQAASGLQENAILHTQTPCIGVGTIDVFLLLLCQTTDQEQERERPTSSRDQVLWHEFKAMTAGTLKSLLCPLKQWLL